MNENENNFESLRQLLAHKRQELPPPGYYNSFSGQIIARIRAGEANMPQTDEERFFSQAPWVLRLLRAFELKPAFAGAFASGLSVLLVLGIIYAERPDSSTQPILQASEPSIGSFAAVTPAALAYGSSSGISGSNSASMSLQPVASLFGSQNTFAQPVSFSPAGN